jgi:hypothetical protein
MRGFSASSVYSRADASSSASRPVPPQTISRPSDVTTHEPGSAKPPPSHTCSPVAKSRQRTFCHTQYTRPPWITGVHALE